MHSFDQFKENLENLCANSKLERERAETYLVGNTKYFTECSVITIDWINNKLGDDKSLEISLGCLTALKFLLDNYSSLSHDYMQQMSLECVAFLKHDEYRVRILAGECLGVLFQIMGFARCSDYLSQVKDGIVKNLVDLKENSLDSMVEKTDKEHVLNDATGWKLLETWMKCFQCIIIGLGPSFEDFNDQELLAVIFKANDHINRFVRESGYDLIGTVAEYRGYARNRDFYIRACDQLGRGLSDNWSQVRMSASVAARKLLLATRPSDVTDNEVFKRLLPKICLNRYYLAEGVRLYNQETWRIVVGDNGRQLIEQNIEETVQFYIEQSGAENPGVREAACSSISELAQKLNQDKIRPFLSLLLSALIVRLSDDSCSVRDIACVACGRLVIALPNETKEYRSDVLMPLFLNSLVDRVSSVREGGAYCVASVVSIFYHDKSSFLKEVLDFIYESLENVRHQKEKPCTQLSIDGLLEVTEDFECSEDKKELERPGLSCDSSMPKGVIKAGQRGSSSELWERADGCVVLIGELALQVTQSHHHMPRLISALAEAVGHRHYPQHVYLLVTASNTVTKIYDGLGKQNFKRHLNDIFTILFASLCCDCRLAISAAEDALRFLAVKLGHNVLRGRIEMYSPEFLDRTNRLFEYTGS